MLDPSSHAMPAQASFGVVGTWHWQIASGGVILDRGSATLLTGNAALAGEVLDLDASFACLHPEDRGRVLARVAEHERRGGAILMQYQVRAPDGRVRLLLDRGQVIEGPDGDRLGYGVILDITDAPSSDVSVDALTQIVDRCLAVRAVLLSHGTPTMRALIDALLLEIGWALAERAGAPDLRRLQ